MTRATVNNLKDLAKAVSRIKDNKNVLEIPKLPKDATKWSLEVYTDASWQNIEGTGSTAGKVIIVKGGGKSFPVTWSSNRLRRVCHSSMNAEIMAMNEGLTLIIPVFFRGHVGHRIILSSIKNIDDYH